MKHRSDHRLKKPTRRRPFDALSMATGLAAVLLCGAARAGVDDLDWMTGSWSGPMGANTTLEENWARPEGGNISALVRASGNGRNSMVELIVVEEADDTLVLHIQQWNPGFEPRSENAQRMVLESLGDRTVTFRATTAGGLGALTYSRPDPDTFTVGVELADGTKIPITLKAQ